MAESERTAQNTIHRVPLSEEFQAIRVSIYLDFILCGESTTYSNCHIRNLTRVQRLERADKSRKS